MRRSSRCTHAKSIATRAALGSLRPTVAEEARSTSASSSSYRLLPRQPRLAGARQVLAHRALRDAARRRDRRGGSSCTRTSVVEPLESSAWHGAPTSGLSRPGGVERRSLVTIIRACLLRRARRRTRPATLPAWTPPHRRRPLGQVPKWSGIGAQVLRNQRPGAAGTGAQVTSERVPRSGRNHATQGHGCRSRRHDAQSGPPAPRHRTTGSERSRRRCTMHPRSLRRGSSAIQARRPRAQGRSRERGDHRCLETLGPATQPCRRHRARRQLVRHDCRRKLLLAPFASPAPMPRAESRSTPCRKHAQAARSKRNPLERLPLAGSNSCCDDGDLGRDRARGYVERATIHWFTSFAPSRLSICGLPGDPPPDQTTFPSPSPLTCRSDWGTMRTQEQTNMYRPVLKQRHVDAIERLAAESGRHPDEVLHGFGRSDIDGPTTSPAPRPSTASAAHGSPQAGIASPSMRKSKSDEASEVPPEHMKGRAGRLQSIGSAQAMGSIEHRIDIGFRTE